MDKIDVHSVIQILHLKGYNSLQIHNEMLADYGSDNSLYDTVVKSKMSNWPLTLHR